MFLLFALAAPGCGVFWWNKPPPPPPIESPMTSPYADLRTFAIAPTINLSGSRDFDPLTVSDTLFVEMQQVSGLNVMPVNKTLIAMQRLGIRSIDDVATAQQLAAVLGADALVIPAITAYDPYHPPTIGMILQLYTPPPRPVQATPASAEPIQWRPAPAPGMPRIVSERAVSNPAGSAVVGDVNADKVGKMGENIGPNIIGPSTDFQRPVAAVSPASAPRAQPVAQVSAVFNASNQSVLKELTVFAAGRTQYDSALSDQKFLKDADSYMRFVAHAMIRRLLEVERLHPTDR
jgi:hypothetical protein